MNAERILAGWDDAELFRALVESAPDATVVAYEDGRIVHVNSQAMKLFGYSREKATQLMLQVHHEGKAVVSSGTRAEAERDLFRLHEHGLWATMQQD